VPASIISEVLSDAQECTDAAAFRTRVLEHVGRLLPFDSAILLPTRDDVGRPASIGKDRRLIRQFLAERQRYESDLQKGRVAARARGGAYIDTEVYTLGERSNLPFFVEIIRPQGISSQLAAHVRFHQRMTCVLHLCRHGTSRPFRDRDLERLLSVLPALAVSHSAFDGSAILARATPTPTPAPEVGSFCERFETLSPREREIARYVAYGYRNRDIATAVGASPHTVRNHLYQVFAKLGTTGRTELAVWMERSGLAVRSY
jgi:DNA-binding CsgD family transcriptional regulator